MYHGVVKRKPDQEGNALSARAQSILAKLINLFLLLMMTVATFFCFFAIQELLLTVAARLIYHGMDSAVRQRYALVVTRNLWLIGGGALLVGFTIGFFNYFATRLDHARTRERLLLILLAELGIIALSRVVAG